MPGSDWDLSMSVTLGWTACCGCIVCPNPVAFVTGEKKKNRQTCVWLGRHVYICVNRRDRTTPKQTHWWLVLWWWYYSQYNKPDPSSQNDHLMSRLGRRTKSVNPQDVLDKPSVQVLVSSRSNIVLPFPYLRFPDIVGHVQFFYLAWDIMVSLTWIPKQTCVPGLTWVVWWHYGGGGIMVWLVVCSL